MWACGLRVGTESCGFIVSFKYTLYIGYRHHYNHSIFYCIQKISSKIIVMS